MKSTLVTSVAAKLAGATVAVIAVATAGIYLRLSAYQRESLLRAKEASATAVSRLFADSCAAAVVFDNPDDLQNTLTTLGHNEAIEYAAVWQVDQAGRIGRQLGELSRGRPETVAVVPQTIVLRRDRDRVVPVAPVRDLEGTVVGVVATAFSLADENAAIARLERTALLTSSAVAVGLTILLMWMARLVVVGPLAKLVRAANRLEEGRAVEIDVTSNDEVGKLARALRSMAAAIHVREERINTRNRDMRLVMDNVGQGFVTLDSSGSMSEERSRIVDEWFGQVQGPLKLWDYLRRVDPAWADYFELAWSAVVDDVLPVELCFEQLPTTVRHLARTFKLDYHPIFKDGAVDKTVVVITEITVRLERERSEQRQRETMSIYRRLLADRPAFEGFFAEASGMVRAITETTETELSLVKRQVHTLKGNCALFGIESVAELCHAIEDRFDDGPSVREEDRVNLRAAWAAMAETVAALTAGDGAAAIALTREDYQGLLVDVRRHVDYQTLAQTIEAWQFEPAAKRLALIREQIELLASRLGKAEVAVVCDPTTLRLSSPDWSVFWSAFAHVIRNTVDHGMETTEQRLAIGKTARATIRVGISHEGQEVLVSVDDDGPGLDWKAIAARARARGRPHGTPGELEAALFEGGLSSQTEADGTSGRGVGLGAIRAVVSDLGGRLTLTSGEGSGARLRCWLPGSMLVSPRSPEPIEPAAPVVVTRPSGPATAGLTLAQGARLLPATRPKPPPV